MLKHLHLRFCKLQEKNLPVRLLNTTNERRLVQGHETPLRVKGDIEDVSSGLDNGGQRLHFLDEMAKILMLSDPDFDVKSYFKCGIENIDNVNSGEYGRAGCSSFATPDENGKRRSSPKQKILIKKDKSFVDVHTYKTGRVLANRKTVIYIYKGEKRLTHSLTNHDISGTIKPTDLKFGRKRGHGTTPLSVKGDIEDVSSEVDSGS
ncbi:uncharacterized protein TNCV_17871 [Trichonephila clavipes]|nr:uncharacterized protein TNCV_17871 [Trichonephila clavipes]